MRISYKWLQDFVDIDILGMTPEELGETLTTVGLAVELIEEEADDVIFDLDVTANRSDCLNHLGVARELAAYYRLNLRYPDFSTPGHNSADEQGFPATVEILAPELCPRYSARVITDVKIGESPEWLKDRLEAIGQRPINNLVDITNYILFEIGQPLHAFDYEKLAGRRIVVRRGGKEEKITTLDGVERVLNETNLAICDQSVPVALAGVMGGLDSEIDDQTTTILLESAYFDPVSIRRTAKSLGMSTEASFRFERGADPEITVNALNRATAMIVDLCGGRCVSPVIDEHPAPYVKKDLTLHLDQIKRLVGIEIPAVQVEEILSHLELNPASVGEGAFRVNVPGFRSDIEFEADLVEEVARHHGYENIPGTYPPANVLGKLSRSAAAEKIIVGMLVEYGFHEAVTYSLTTPAEEKLFFGGDSPMTRLANPLTEDGTHLRTTLIPGLVRSLGRNLNVGNREVRLFEIGNVFPSEDGSGERPSLGLAACGPLNSHFSSGRDNPFTFHHLKGVLEEIFRKLSLPLHFESVDETDLLHPGAAAAIKLEDGTAVGLAGQLHPSVQGKLKIQERVYVAEVDLVPAYRKPLPSPLYRPFGRFPSVERDLSFILDRSVEFGRIESEVKGLELSALREFRLIDLYQGENIADDKVSLTVRMVFSDPDRTLVQEEVDSACDQVRGLLQRSFSAEMR